MVENRSFASITKILAAKLINRDTPPGKGVGKNELAGLRDGIVVRAKEANLKGSFHLLTFMCVSDRGQIFCWQLRRMLLTRCETLRRLASNQPIHGLW